MKCIGLLFLLLPFLTVAQTEVTRYYLKPKEKTNDIPQALVDSTLDILNKRLSGEGYKNTTVLYNYEKKYFVITANDFIDTNYITLLLIKPCKVFIYELYTAENIVSALAFTKREKSAVDLIHRFYNLLNINSENFEMLKRSSHLGILDLKDTAQFRLIKTTVQPYLPADLTFALSRQPYTLKEQVVNVYGLRNDNSQLNVNTILKKIYAGKDAVGHASIKLEFNEEGKKLFGRMTSKNQSRSIAITIDNKVIVAPFVKGAIEGGEIEITGNFTTREVAELTSLIAAGSLPLQLNFSAKE